jgi:hypothetical protein
MRPRGAIMNNERDKLNYEFKFPESDQVKFARRWADELKGRNRKQVIELMSLIAEGEITSEEAFALLDNRSE